jgi:hypothetical protein
MYIGIYFTFDHKNKCTVPYVPNSGGDGVGQEKKQPFPVILFTLPVLTYNPDSALSSYE